MISARQAGWTVWALGVAAAAAQALALAAGHFQSQLQSDYIYPHLFAADVLGGRYPLSGWTLSSAPYFFPDFAGCIVLLAWFGGDGTLFAAYGAGYFVAASVVLGWAAARARPETGMVGWLVGPLVVNFLLLGRDIGDHARYLWWLGTPGFHGGAVLLGFAEFALWAGPLDTEPGRIRRWVAGALLAAGALSDTLLLVQFVGPLLLAFLLCGWRGHGLSRRIKSFGRVVVWALACVVALRVTLALAGFFSFSKVVRYAPWPSAILGAGTSMWRDMRETILPGGIGLAALAVAGLIAWAWQVWRERAAEPGQRLAGVWVGLVLTTALTVPVVTVYWRDAQNARHLLPWVVLPAWWLGMVLAGALSRLMEMRGPVMRSVMMSTLGALFVGAGLWAADSWSRERWRWPVRTEVTELVETLRRRGHTHGLSDYWNAHYLNQLGGGTVRLNQLRPDGRTYFWNNNAFWHFDADSAGRLTRPPYSFIIVTRLDRAAVAARFGAPAERLNIGGQEVWLYDAGPAAEFTRGIEREVRDRLRGRPGEERLPPG